MIVMGELEGLGKMKDHEASSPEHAATVREASRAALTWIREKHTNVKCVTTKGEPIETPKFLVLLCLRRLTTYHLQ